MHSSAIVRRTSPMQNPHRNQLIYKPYCKIYAFLHRSPWAYKPNAKSIHFRNEIIVNPMRNLRMSVAISIQALCNIYAFPIDVTTNPMQNLSICLPKSQALCNQICILYKLSQRNHYKPYAESMHSFCGITTNPIPTCIYFPNEIITNPMQNLCNFIAKSIQILCKIYAFSYRNRYKPFTKSMHLRSEKITSPMQNLCTFVL